MDRASSRWASINVNERPSINGAGHATATTIRSILKVRFATRSGDVVAVEKANSALGNAANTARARSRSNILSLSGIAVVGARSAMTDAYI